MSNEIQTYLNAYVLTLLSAFPGFGLAMVVWS